MAIKIKRNFKTSGFDYLSKLNLPITIHTTILKKQSLLLSVLTCFVLLSCKQHQEKNIHSSKNDSIKKYFRLMSSNSISTEKRIQYNDKAYSFIDTTKNDSITMSYIRYVCFNYFESNDWKKMDLYAKNFVDRSTAYGDLYWIAEAKKYRGYSLLISSKNDLALKSFIESKKIFLNLGLFKELETVYIGISDLQYYNGDFLGSNKTIFECINLMKKNQIVFNYPNFLNSIGNNLSAIKNENEAIKYYLLCKKKSNRPVTIFSANNNLTSSYINIGKYDEAEKCINENINYRNPIGKDFEATAISLKGLVLLKKNDNTCFSFFKKADNIFTKINAINGQNYNQMYLSEYYAKVKDTLNAIKAAKNAVTISKSYKNPNDILLTLKQLIKVDKKNASINGQEYIRLNDSLQIAERSFRDKFARIQFETDEITKEKDIAVQHKQNVIIGASILLILGILFFIIYRQRTSKKKLLLEQSNQKINEEIYQLMLSQKNNEEAITQKEKKRIALELHDGVMNKLASTRLNLFVLSKKNDPETIKKCISHIAEIQFIEQEIRNIAHDLNNEIFKTENSFIQMLKDLIQNKESNSLTQYEIEIDKTIPWEKISSEIKMNLYRILQEAIHNIEKHANAKKATISLIKDQNNIGMSVSDNGIGFDTQKKKNGIGIQNMLYRVKNLNGKISINSFPNSNTSINISIPIS